MIWCSVEKYFLNFKAKSPNKYNLVNSSPSAESRKFGFMAHSRGTAETCHILIFD